MNPDCYDFYLWSVGRLSIPALEGDELIRNPYERIIPDEY